MDPNTRHQLRIINPRAADVRNRTGLHLCRGIQDLHGSSNQVCLQEGLAMSIPVVKWIPGAPERLKVGMVLRSGKEVDLIVSFDETKPANQRKPNHMRSGAPIEAHGQLVDAYVLEWLGDDGIVKEVSR